MVCAIDCNSIIADLQEALRVNPSAPIESLRQIVASVMRVQVVSVRLPQEIMRVGELNLSFFGRPPQNVFRSIFRGNKFSFFCSSCVGARGAYRSWHPSAPHVLHHSQVRTRGNRRCRAKPPSRHQGAHLNR